MREMNSPARIRLLGLILFSIALFFVTIPHVIGKPKQKSSPKVVVVGLNAANKSVVNVVPYPEYRGALSLALRSVNDSVTPVLEKHAALEKPEAQGWHINSIGVGLGMSAQVGIGPLLNLTITPQLRLIFSDSLNPIYPN